MIQGVYLKSFNLFKKVIHWITCPANQRSSSPTPFFSDRLMWGMTRGSKHRYHRKYCKRIPSNTVKCVTDRVKSKSRGVKDGFIWPLLRLCLLMALYVPVKCKLCWKTQRWRCAGNSRKPGQSERPMTPPTAGWAVAGMLPDQATGSTCCLHQHKTK